MLRLVNTACIVCRAGSVKLSGVHNVCLSVPSFTCSTPLGRLLLKAVPEGDIERQWWPLGARQQRHNSTAYNSKLCSSANASSVTLTADVGIINCAVSNTVSNRIFHVPDSCDIPSLRILLNVLHSSYTTTTTTTTTTVLRPLYRSTCVSGHLQLKNGGFCW